MAILKPDNYLVYIVLILIQNTSYYDFEIKKKKKKPSGQINKKYSLNFRKILTVILDVKGLYYIGLMHFSSPKFK